jgi:hypothetical protein
MSALLCETSIVSIKIHWEEKEEVMLSSQSRDLSKD